MKKRGFTLLELLLVIAILAILVIIAIPNVVRLFNSAKKDTFETEIKNIYNIARDEYAQDAFGNLGRQVYCNTGDCDDNKLDISGGSKTKYSIKLNANGEVLCFQATNGSYYYMSQGKLDNILDIQYVHQVDDKNVNFVPDCTYSVDYRQVKRINVLNIYPDRTSGTKYPVKKRTGTFTGCQSYKKYISSSLKDWMEDPTDESPNGYGKGIIKVIPVSFTQFNENPDPDYWVKDFYDNECIQETDEELADDTLNRTTADLIFIGTWDANANTKYSQGSIDALVNWTRNGKAIIASHDVILEREAESADFTKAIKGLFGLDVHGANSAIGPKVFILTEKKKNVFTLWPWTITNKGKDGKDGLTIPSTHATGQYVIKGDVWISLGATRYTEEKAKQNKFYLETYENTALIQVGHSNCAATDDEQKIVANTIFFMYYKFVLHENGDDMDLIE